MEHKNFIQKLGFLPKDNAQGIFYKKYPNAKDYSIEVDFELNKFNFGKLLTAESKTTQNFSQAENWVILECVDRLLVKGYSPKNIKLEKTWATGHGTSGRLDILVTRDDGTAYMMIECKTYVAEFDKEYKKILKDGGQLFTYFQQDKNAEILMLYASELDKKGHIQYKNEIVKIEEDYRQAGNVKDFHDRWNKLPKNNGVFDDWVKPYDFKSKALTPKTLKEIKQSDSSFIFNRFLEILRHNVVSDKPNAFNKIFTLFLCKIYDEKSTKNTQELAFQWLEGVDDHISFQKRLTDLYRKGMKEFLDKEVSDMSDEEFETKFGLEILSEAAKQQILEQFTIFRLKKNNEFAIKEVFDDASFEDNAKVVKEVVELLQGYKIRYTKRHQYLSDFFEMLLTTGLKQESGQFFTPVPVAQFIIKSIPLDEIVLDKLNKGEADNLLPTIIDYAAGSGHFLTESMHEVQRILDRENPDDYIDSIKKKIQDWQNDHFNWAIQYVYGIEKDYRLVKVGKVGCYLHGDGLAKVIHGDGLANFTETKEYQGKLKVRDKYYPQENKQFDILISNPPYSVSAFKGTLKNVENEFELFNDLTDQSSQIECLFIERTKQLLKDGGIAGIILPSSILNNAGIYTKSREIILQYFDIVAIAELGSNTFMATGTNTVTLFLRRRKNETAKNVRLLSDRFAANMQDVTINGIEKPVSKYVGHVWEGITYSDYLTLMQRQPNEAIQNHEIYKEYVKKIAAKTEADKQNIILEKEQEKLFYFIIAFPQKVVLVKSGEKNEEKQFLGYEFSNRRGSEGIHPIQRSKSIDECTQLFDPEVFDNPQKASTYIYKAFQGNFDVEIVPDLQKNISRHNLVDMLTFDRVDFEKNISLSSKKKITIESRWEKVTVSNVVEIVGGGTPDTGNSDYWNGEIPWLSVVDFNNENRFVSSSEKKITESGLKNSSTKYLDAGDLIISARGTVGALAQLQIPMTFNQSCYGLKGNEKVDNGFLYYILKSEIGQLKSGSYGAIFKAITTKTFDEIKIPLPPKEIQKKIVEEIEILEERELEAKEEVQRLKDKITSTIEAQLKKQETKKLGEICDMKAGKFVSASDIYDKPEQVMYPCFGGNGLRGYTKTFTHDGKYSLIGRQGALCGNVCIANGKFHATEHAVVVTPNSDIKTEWLYHKLINLNLNQYATGTAQPGLSVENLKTVSISVLPLSEQEKIVVQVEAIEGKIAVLEKEIGLVLQKKVAILKKYL